jgi:hypothetical protein
VSPEPIESGKPFTATLDGFAVFPEAMIDAGHELLERGVQKGNLVELNATVQVRSGATADDVVVLKPKPVSYTCDFDGSPCDPDHDVLDDPPDPPGLRGNTDCEPVSPANACGRFLFVPTSTDCEPGGICADLGKTNQCVLHSSCITGDLEIPLQQVSARYTAEAEGDVLFGWADQGTGATEQEGGPNHGTWILPILYNEDDPLRQEAYQKPTGPIGLRATFAGFPVTLECTMGVNCKDFSVGCSLPLPSPTPDSELISFPIQPEAP